MSKRLQAVLFDFDGTLTHPESLDFSTIRQAIGCPTGTPILEYIATLAPGAPRHQAIRILEQHELEAAKWSQPNAGAENLIIFLKSLKLKLGILTRNSLNSVSIALRNFLRVRESDFDTIITRHDPVRPKPHPEGVLLAASRMGVVPDKMLVVGNYVFDIESGQQAGARTVFLHARAATRLPDPPADFSIKTLKELPVILKNTWHISDQER